MPDRLRSLFARYREAILYLFFGGLTTLCNIVVFMGLSGLGLSTAAANAWAWGISVLFAYVTNRRWVFESRVIGGAAIAREMGTFFGARILTGLLDTGIVVLLVDRFGMPKLLIKIASNVLVIVLNYVFSKLVIFRKGADRQ